MRLSLTILGHEILAIDTTTADAGPRPTQDRGDSTSYPIGFIAHMERPHEMQTPDRDW